MSELALIQDESITVTSEDIVSPDETPAVPALSRDDATAQLNELTEQVLHVQQNAYTVTARAFAIMLRDDLVNIATAGKESFYVYVERRFDIPKSSAKKLGAEGRFILAAENGWDEEVHGPYTAPVAGGQIRAVAGLATRSSDPDAMCAEVWSRASKPFVAKGLPARPTGAQVAKVTLPKTHPLHDEFAKLTRVNGSTSNTKTAAERQAEKDAADADKRAGEADAAEKRANEVYAADFQNYLTWDQFLAIAALGAHEFAGVSKPTILEFALVENEGGEDA